MKNYSKNILFVLLGLSSMISVSQKYEGTIDNFKIFLEFDRRRSNETELLGHYFYQNHLKNINLEGSIKDNKVILMTKTSLNQSEMQEIFRLKKEGDLLIGTWESRNKQREVKLELTEIDFEHFKRENIESFREKCSKIW